MRAHFFLRYVSKSKMNTRAPFVDPKTTRDRVRWRSSYRQFETAGASTRWSTGSKPLKGLASYCLLHVFFLVNRKYKDGVLIGARTSLLLQLDC